MKWRIRVEKNKAVVKPAPACGAIGDQCWKGSREIAPKDKTTHYPCAATHCQLEVVF